MSNDSLPNKEEFNRERQPSEGSYKQLFNPEDGKFVKVDPAQEKASLNKRVEKEDHRKKKNSNDTFRNNNRSFEENESSQNNNKFNQNNRNNRQRNQQQPLTKTGSNRRQAWRSNSKYLF